MQKTGWQQNWIRWLSLFFVLGIMGALFYFSAQPHGESEKSSEALAKVIQKTGVAGSKTAKKIISPVIHTDEELPVEDQAQQIARKLGHILIFAALGFWLRIGLESWFGKKKNWFWWSLLIGVLYGATDELHQLFVFGRSAEVHDVFVDGLGVLIGVLTASWTTKTIEKRVRHSYSG